MPLRPVLVPSADRSCGILDVTGCRWPIATDHDIIGGHAFCNHSTGAGKPYCEFHTRESVASYSQKLIRKTIGAALHAYAHKRRRVA